MPLETATYVDGLVTTNPAASDGMNNSDDHMRLIKAVLKSTFPNITGAISATHTQINSAVSAIVTGLTASRFFAGTAALPGVTPVGDTDTGWYAPAADQLAASTAGVQRLLMTTTALSTSLPFVSAALTSTGAYTGGTGQLVPIGATLLWWDDVLPTEGGYAWANGQIIASANTVCPILLARWGTRFGGNGTTTMGVPDLRDTVPVGKSTMGAVASRALHTLSNTVLGTLIGVANQALVLANLPSLTPTGTITNGAITVSGSWATGGGASNNNGGGGGIYGAFSTYAGATASQAASTFAGNAMGGTSVAVNNVQPSTTCNYIVRIA